MKINPEVVARKWNDLKMGKVCITNSLEMDLFPSDDPAMNFLKSFPNPNRVGILDQYIAFIGYDIPRAHFFG